MGTVAKKTVTKPAPKPAGKSMTEQAAMLRAVIPLTTNPLIDALALACSTATQELSLPVEKRNAMVHQDVLSAVLILWCAATDLKKSLEVIEGSLKAYKNASGAFEHGRFAILFKSVDKASPKWKEEAIKVAKALHEALNDGTVFDAAKWAEATASAYPKNTSVSLDIVESA